MERAVEKCDDCSGEIPYIYMIKHELWYGLGLTKRSNLCLPCLSKRMGRQLRDSDFVEGVFWHRYIKVLSILEHGFYPGE